MKKQFFCRQLGKGMLTPDLGGRQGINCFNGLPFPKAGCCWPHAASRARGKPSDCLCGTSSSARGAGWAQIIPCDLAIGVAELLRLIHSTQRSLTVNRLHTVDGLQSLGTGFPTPTPFQDGSFLQGLILWVPHVSTSHPFPLTKAESQQRCMTKMQMEGSPNNGRIRSWAWEVKLWSVIEDRSIKQLAAWASICAPFVQKGEGKGAL